MSIKVKNITRQLQHIISYHNRFINTVHFPYHIIINFVLEHVMNNSNREQAASSISQTPNS